MDAPRGARHRGIGGPFSRANHLHAFYHAPATARHARGLESILLKWPEATGEYLDARILQLVPELARFAPPAQVVDKTRYSAFVSSQLTAVLRHRNADALIITGGETDVCVLSTALSAVDLGWRVIIVRDAICSSSDQTHDASLEVYHKRYSLQIETAAAEEISKLWPCETMGA